MDVAIAAQVVREVDEGHSGRGGVLLLLLFVILGAAWVVDLLLTPWLPCRTCGGSGKRRSLFVRSAHGPCLRCGGSGRRLRSAGRLIRLDRSTGKRRGSR